MSVNKVMTHQAGERAVKAIARRLHDDSKYGTYSSHEDVIARFERTLWEMGVDALIDAGEANASPVGGRWRAALDKVLKAGG